MEWTFVLISVFAVFIPALMLPGPDFIAVVRTSMAYGTVAGLLTTLGVSMGLAFYAALSLLGLSAVLIEYQWLAWMIRLCGGCYLVYLGIRLIFARPIPIDVAAATSNPRGNPLVFGFLVALTNPKAIVLFTSVFATAVTANMPLWVSVLMILLVFACAMVWYAIVSIFMSSAPIIKRFRNAQHRIEQAAGFCFIVIGGRILADSKNPLT